MGVLQKIVRARGPGGGIGMRKGFGRHQVQLRQAHDFHSPGGRADVARVGGIDQNNANSGQTGCRIAIASGILCRLLVHG